MSNATGGWHPDPSGRHELRYWDGAAWTEHVSDGGVAGVDPVDGPPQPSVQPFGAQTYGAQPYGAQPLPQYGAQPYSPQPYGATQAVGYGVASAPPGQRLSGLSTALTLLLGLTGLLSLAFAGALFNRASVLDDGGASFTDLRDADDTVAATVGLFLLAYAVTGVVWVIWQFRHAKNARALGQPPGELGPGWAIGGWFIPLGNFVLPQLQLFQAARASDPDSPGRGSVPGLVIGWWVTFAIGGLINVFSGRYFGDDLDELSDLESFQTADRTAAVGSLVVTGAAVVAILMVRALTARQQRALEARGQLV